MTDINDNLRMLEKQGEDYIWRTAEAARKEIEQLRAVLDELIACKNLQIKYIDHREPWYTAELLSETKQLRIEFHNRDPLAWAEARRLRGKG